MSYENVEAVITTLKVGKPLAKYVLLLLAWHQNKKTGLCCPSLATLVEESGLSKTAVRDAIEFLVVNGYVKKEQQMTSGGRVKQTGYTLLIPETENGNDVSGSDISRDDISPDDTTLYRETIQDVSPDDTTLYRQTIPNKEIEHGNEQGNKNKEIDASPDKPKKTKKPKKAQEPLVFPDDVPEAIREEWIRYKKRQSGYLTQRMIDHITREAKKVGFTTSQAMEYQMDRNWIGFEASYVKDKNGNTNAKKRADKDRWCTAENADDWDLIYGPMPTGANS